MLLQVLIITFPLHLNPQQYYATTYILHSVVCIDSNHNVYKHNFNSVSGLL
jgi:hypothetical protein